MLVEESKMFFGIKGFFLSLTQITEMYCIGIQIKMKIILITKQKQHHALPNQ